ncbi:MAG: voltage-gated potassium channel [Candidatus Latescibacterota bacterium]|jgi:voltage-gated potassium channel
MNLREHTYYLLEPGDDTGRIIDFSIVILIFLNVLALIFETVEPIYRLNRSAFEAFENFSLVVFSIEYLLRLWSCTTNPRYAHPVKGRLHFFFSFFGLIDLLAILPFFLPFFGIDLRFVRTVRLLRIFRIVKLVRYSRALRLLGKVVMDRKEELLSIFFVLLTLLVVSSSLMYFVEHDVQPEVFPSIPSTMWWGIVTLTTVGYGDAFPITALGQTIAAIIAVLGIGMFALPAGILGAGFTEELERMRVSGDVDEPAQCPHCGEHI